MQRYNVMAVCIFDQQRATTSGKTGRTDTAALASETDMGWNAGGGAEGGEGVFLWLGDEQGAEARERAEATTRRMWSRGGRTTDEAVALPVASV